MRVAALILTPRTRKNLKALWFFIKSIIVFSHQISNVQCDEKALELSKFYHPKRFLHSFCGQTKWSLKQFVVKYSLTSILCASEKP